MNEESDQNVRQAQQEWGIKMLELVMRARAVEVELRAALGAATLIENELREALRDKGERRARQERDDKLADEHNAIWADHVLNITNANERICKALERVAAVLEYQTPSMAKNG